MERKSAKSFEDLLVWRKAHALALAVYRKSESLPRSETFGLKFQVRKAVVSVPANIAEGFKKLGARDKVRFMNIAQGSLEEVRYYLILTRDLGWRDLFSEMALVEDVSILLERYRSSIASSCP